jgi:VCBS repeat-containing protein
MMNNCSATSAATTVTVKPTPSTPTISVVDNCNGTSTLTASNYTGSLLWSTNETSSSITVSSAGTYTVTQSVNGCTSAAGAGLATPKTTPSTPVITVVDNCNGTSTLSTTATGSLLWSTNATTSSITATNITQSIAQVQQVLINTSCGDNWEHLRTVVVVDTNAVKRLHSHTSAAGAGLAAPKTTPSTPVITVVDNCNGTSTLSTTATGSLLWSTNATTSSITVSSAGTYTVTQSVNGCTSAAGSGLAAPKTTPSAPVVTVVDNCNGTSTLSTAATGSLLWSAGQTTPSISVSSAGTYTVTQTVNGCTSAAGSGIAAPKTTPVVINYVSSPNCDGSITVTANNATGSLIWTPNGETTNSIIVTVAGTYGARQTISGCTSNPAPIVVTPIAVPATYNVSGGAALCAGVPQAVTIALSGSETGVTYTLYKDGVNLNLSRPGTGGGISFQNAFGPGTYTIQATKAGLPPACNYIMSGLAAVTVKPTPAAPGIMVVDNCNGTSTLSTPAAGGLLWSTNETTSSITVSSAGTYTVTQTVNGCVSAAGSGIAAPKTAPTAVITVDGPSTVCPGGSIILHATAGVNYTYQWTKDGGAIEGEYSADYVATESGAYSVQITTPENCAANAVPVTLTIGDTTPPVVPAISDIVASCYVEVTAPVAIDACGGPITGISDNPRSFIGLGVWEIHWTFTDASGNTSTAVQKVTLIDTTPPVAHCPGNISVPASTTDNGHSGAIVSYEATATDNCNAFVSYSIEPGSFFPVGTTTVTVTATDNAGNTDVCTFDVTVTCITQTPIITAVGPTTFCPGGSVVLRSSSATGNRWSTGAVTQSIIVNASGSYSVTVTDATSGCSATSAATVVTVEDVTPPVTPTLANVIAECSATATIPTTADACSGTVTGTTTDALSYHTQGDHIVHWIFTDASGNSTTADQHVIILDVTPPGIVCPANITKQATTTGSGYGALVTYAATATDNCGTPTLTYSPVSGSFFAAGTTTTVTVTANDGNGHTSTCRFDVTVIAPEINITGNNVTIVDGDVTPSLTDNTNFGSTTLGTPIVKTFTIQNTGDDNLDVSAINISGTDAANFTVSGFTATVLAPGASANFTVTFLSNTVGTKNATVTVSNNDYDESSYDFVISADINCSTPVFTACPSNITTNTDAGLCSAVVNYTPTVTGVPAPSLTYTFTGATTGSGAGDGHGKVFNKGVTTVTITAHNACGDAVCRFTITVEDHEKPVIAGMPSNISKSNDAGVCGAAIYWPVPVATDNCPIVTLVSDYHSGDVFQVGTTTVHYTATDASGNTSGKSFDVTVTDDENPTITLPADVTHTADAGLCSYKFANTAADINTVTPDGPTPGYGENAILLGSATGTDNCGMPTVVGARSDGLLLTDPYPVGVTTVTWTVTDSHGHTTTGMQTITITDDEFPVIHYLPVNITTGTDANSCTATVTWTAPTSTDNCAVTMVSNHQSGDVFPIGTTTVTYTATDIHGHVTTGSFAVTVADNQLPTIACPQDIIISAQPGKNGANVTYIVTAGDNCGTPVLTYTIASGSLFAIGSTPVTATATDANGNHVSCTFNVIVNNNPPVANPDVNTTTEDTPVSGNILPNDTDLDGHSLAVTSFILNSVSYTAGQTATFAEGTLVLGADGNYTYTPAANFNGPVPVVTYYITDGHGGAAHTTLTINVTPVNDGPVANPDTNTTQEDTPVSGNVLPNDTDLDGDVLTVTGFVINGTPYTPGTIALMPGIGDLVINANGTYTYVPAPNYNGPVPVVTYAITDGHGGTASSTLTINVTPVDDAPVAVNDTETVNEDGVLTATVTGNDTPSGDGGNVWSVVTTTTHGTLVFNNDGTYTYTPNANFNGTDVFTYKVCDADGDCSTATVTITVVSVDDAPIAVNDTETVNEDGVLTATVTGNDTPSGDGGNVWSVVTSTTHGTLVLNNDGTYTYTPNANFNGTDVFTYKVCDADGDCSTATVTITVVSVDDAPVAVNDTETVNEDGVLTATVTGNDTPSGDGGNTWSVVTTTTHGTLVFNPDGSYTYTPDANYNGPDSFTYKVCDADGDCSTATVNITVIPVNDIPLAVNDAVSTNEDVAIHSTVAGNDTASPDGGNVWSVVTTTTHGTLVFNTDGSYVYTPNANYNGPDAFTYKVCDINGDCATATVNITVIPVNDDPIIKVKNITVYVDATGHVSITPGQIDDGSSDPDGIASITLNRTDFSCADIATSPNTVTLTVTDVNGNSMSANATVTVLDAIAPTITCPAPATVQCASAVPAPNTASVIAADNCSYTVSFVSDAISNQTAPNKYTITRTYKAVDPSGNSATCTQIITVNDNTAPTLIVAGSLPGNSNGQCLAGVPGAPATAGIAALYSDNCSGTVTAVLTSTTTTGSNAAGWIRKYFYAVTDASGNTTTACVTYSGKDTQAPVPVLATLPTVTAQCGATVTAPTATDNCAGTITATTSSPLTYNAQGTYTITWTYTDGNGNTSAQTQTVIVKDVTPPAINCPSDITVNANTTVSGQAGANVNFAATATDNCTVPTITYSKAPNSFFPTGTTTVTATANDGNGNTSTCTFKVTVNCVVPVFTTCPSNKTVNTDAGLCSAVVAYTSAATGTASVACNYTFSGATTGSGTGNGSGKVFNRGTTTVTITASNLCGTATCSFTVTVADLEKPRITAPMAYSVPNDAGKCGATLASIGTPVTSDNCGVASVTNNHPSTYYPVGKTIVTWTVTDVNGNVTDTAKQCITVMDNEMPTISVTNISVGNSAGICGANLTLAAPVTSDNCGVASVTNDHSSAYYPVGTTTVTWTVTDNAGWTKTTTQTVTVTDTEKPVIVCLPNITIACGLLPLPANTGVATATDNCGVASVTYTDAVNGNITTRTWKAVDAAGNTSTCSQTITVGGPFNTSITSVPTSNTYTGGTANSLFIGYGAQSTVLQSTVPAGVYTYVWSGADAAMLSNTNTANPVFTPTKGGSFTFTVTVKNLLGCTSTASVSICVTDIRVFASVPTNNNCTHQAHNSWNCPHSGHGHSCSHGAHNSYNCPDKDDADDHQGMCNHQSHSSSDCPHKGHNHTCDHRSHSSYNCAHRSCNDRDDDDDHQKTCDHKAHASSDCSHKGHNHATCNHQAHSSSNCPHNSNSSNEQKVCNHQAHNSSDCNHSGHNHGSCNHRSHSAADCPHNGGEGGTDDDVDDKKVYLCHVPPGNTGMRITLTISVNAVAAHLANHPGDRLGSCDQAPCTGYTDNVKPVIDCSDNVTIAYGASTSPAATGSPEADDNSGDVLITYTDASTKGTNASSANYYNYVITRTWKAADLAGNFVTCAQTITVTETTKPVISCPGSVTVACGSTAPATAGNATATDNSGVVAVTYTDAVVGNKTTRTWKATDPSGNYATCVQTITVTDAVKPVIAAANDITVNCGSSTAPAATGTATATDNCSAVTITYSDVNGSNKITRTWKATDASGNYATDVQVITIVDNVNPTITAPNDISISCSASTTPSYCGGSATGSDNCSSVNITYSDVTVGNKITRTWKATDASGNYATDVQVITIVDNTKPVITDVSDITISCGASTTPAGCGSVAKATDNCSTPVVTYNDVTVSNKITRTWTATDAAGNVATSTQIITIVDNVKPVIADLADKTVACGATTPATTGTPAATDACTTPVVTYTDAVSGNKITRTWKATDAAGNYATSAQVITVSDAVKPTITAPNDITVNCSNLVTPATTGTATATDNCSTPTVTYTDATSGNKITRTWKATDASGNYATDAQVITVVDDVKPTITAPADITISCSASTTPSYCGGSATGSDNCSAVSITYSDVTSGNRITRTWKATDASGNYNTDVQLITILDNTKPVISDVSDITISCSQSATPSGCNSVATATDNCSTPVVSYSDVTAGNKITRTWKAVDAAGNTATSTQIITIVDNTKPVITDIADKTVNCGASTLPSATGTATATDNCSTPTVIYTDATSGNLITRTWKATDASGNYSTSVQYITVGSAFTATVTSAPTNSTYTGGINSNLYLGYGAQSTTLTMCSLPSAGAPYTYAWSGSASNKLSSTTAASPLFTPSAAGYFTFNVTVTNKYGCTSFAVIAICVTDIRVAGTNGAKVYVCHTPGGKNKTPQTLQVAISLVSSHLNTTSCGSDGNDRLGSCDQTPCNTSAAQSTTIVGNTTGTTKEAAEEVNTSVEELKVTVMPNPSTTFFTLKMESKYETPISMRVMDGRGRVVDAKTKIGSNSTIQIGHNYSSGTYYAELIQGSQRKVIQLIKARG